MSDAREGRPLSELLTGLVADVSSLFRKEIDLAKAEASEKASRALSGLEMLIAGMVFAIGAIGVLLTAIVSGVSSIFMNMGMDERNADALSAVIVGVVVAIAAWIMISRALSTIKGTNLALERTATSLRRDADVVKGRTI